MIAVDLLAVKVATDFDVDQRDLTGWRELGSLANRDFAESVFTGRVPVGVANDNRILERIEKFVHVTEQSGLRRHLPAFRSCRSVLP